jgi:hypothetical protein
VPVWHASPSCAQKDEGWQVPPLQSPEQHSPPPVQALPSVLQPELRVAHVPAVHVPLQHWLLPVHAPLSGVHAGKPHAPLWHTPLQQAPFVPHGLPSDAHPPSLPNGLPLSPMLTTPLLLPLPALPLLLPVVESPPPSRELPVIVLLLPPQALKIAPETSTDSTATHVSSALRATIMVAASGRTRSTRSPRENSHFAFSRRRPWRGQLPSRAVTGLASLRRSEKVLEQRSPRSQPSATTQGRQQVAQSRPVDLEQQAPYLGAHLVGRRFRIQNARLGARRRNRVSLWASERRL